MLILSSTGFQLRLRGVCKGLTVSPDWDSGTPRRWLEVTEGNQKLICFDPSAWLGSHLLTHSPVSSNPLSTVQLIVTRTGQESRCHEPQTQTGVLYCYLIMRSLTSPCLSRQCSALEQFLLFGVSCPASGRVLVEISWRDFTICFQSVPCNDSITAKDRVTGEKRERM